MKIVYTVRSYEVLREARVVEAGGGFYVVLTDLETGENFPGGWRYESLAEAKDDAEFTAKYDV
jgi:hypothetical protein